jgi:type IV pilus assembly protein PilY1
MSNDGMLHAFEVAKFDSKAVVPRYKPLDKPIELWAYIPEAVLGDLKLNTTSNHNYLADGLLRAIDVKDANGNWRTVLVGIGGKGQSYAFAIDITDPEAPKFLWEINERNNPEVVDKLGTAISAPALGKLNGRWVAIFGTGYSKDFFANYTSKKAYLIIVDILTGQIINEVKVNDKIGNVLTDLVARRSFNGDIEKIYFGDYYGGIWAVPSLKDGGNWKLDEVSELSEDEMLFKPYYYDDVDSVFDVKRPITARPVISRDSDGSWWVFVGSGDYSEYDPSYPHQAFYGLKDLGLTYRDKDNCQPEDSYCGDLKNMTKSSETNPGKGSWIILLGYNDSNDKDSTGKLSRKNSNERVLRKAEVYGGYVFFTTFQPFDEPCGGGISRFYAVKFNTGEMGNQLFSSEVIGSNESGYVSLRSVELKGRGIPSQPMVYVGPSGKGRVVAAGLVNTSSGTLEKIDLNPASFIKNINILLWREVR